MGQPFSINLINILFPKRVNVIVYACTKLISLDKHMHKKCCFVWSKTNESFTFGTQHGHTEFVLYQCTYNAYCVIAESLRHL